MGCSRLQDLKMTQTYFIIYITYHYAAAEYDLGKENSFVHVTETKTIVLRFAKAL
jgi:hypothetical protein